MKAPKLNDERVRPLNRKGDKELRYFQKMITQELHIKALRKLLDQAEADLAYKDTLIKDLEGDIIILQKRVETAQNELHYAAASLLLVKTTDVGKAWEENTLLKQAEVYQNQILALYKKVLHYMMNNNPDYFRSVKKKTKLTKEELTILWETRNQT